GNVMIDVSPDDQMRRDFVWIVAERKKISGEDYYSKEYLQRYLKDKLENIRGFYEEAEMDPYFIFDIEIHFLWKLLDIAEIALEYGFYSRYYNNNVEDLLCGLYTYGRIIYLLN